MRGIHRFWLLTALVLMLTGVSTATVWADATTDAYGRMVFEGKDGWLFYTGDDTIPDYKGTDLFTLSELEAIRQRIQVFSDTLKSQGCEFVLMIEPNKEQLYSQYMPDSYGELTFYTRAQQVTDYLTACGFHVVYPIEELKEAAEEYPEFDIYYRRDTHWNELGAYIGARALMAELGIDMPPIEELYIEPYPHDQPELSRAIGRSLKDTGYNIAGYINEYMETFDALTDYLYRTTKSGVDGRRVLLAGDSFLLGLFPYVSQEFNDVTACFDRDAVVTQLLETVHPDVYVYEVLERYVYKIGTSSALTAPYSWTLAAADMTSDAAEDIIQ